MKTTRDICQIAILAALLFAVKFALSSLANIELVTTLLISYSLALGMKKALPITLIFIVLEMFLYGISVWVLMYLIHWQCIVICACLVRKLKNGMWIAILLGIILTALYGVQTTLLETIFFGGGNISYFKYRYMSGVTFFIVHVVCNVIALPILVPIFSKYLSALEKKYNLEKNIKY